ncbi:hypothetical protein HAX54_030825 [Datura stramonium]|uniref:Transmembrane protein n=1 Tax=Datura stramonium TaxID=4076 RepID=A0ABS8V890_DATST|nr:hypothetical protein [Datura stramonium]
MVVWSSVVSGVLEVFRVAFRFHWWVTSGISVWQWFRPEGKREEEVWKRAAIREDLVVLRRWSVGREGEEICVVWRLKMKEKGEGVFGDWWLSGGRWWCATAMVEKKRRKVG